MDLFQFKKAFTNVKMLNKIVAASHIDVHKRQQGNFLIFFKRRFIFGILSSIK